MKLHKREALMVTDVTCSENFILDDIRTPKSFTEAEEGMGSPYKVKGKVGPFPRCRTAHLLVDIFISIDSVHRVNASHAF